MAASSTSSPWPSEQVPPSLAKCPHTFALNAISVLSSQYLNVAHPAGILTLPKAIASVGIVLGAALFLLACAMTFFSTNIITRLEGRGTSRRH